MMQLWIFGTLGGNPNLVHFSWRRSTPSAIQQAGCGWRALAALAYPSAAMRMLESAGFSGVVTASALLPLAKVEVRGIRLGFKTKHNMG